MAWSASAVFTPFMINNLLRDPDLTLPTGYTNLQADAAKAALYTNSITPNKDDTLTNTGFNAGQWATAQEVTDTSGNGNWASGGRTLASTTLTTGAGFAMYDATDTTGGVAGTGTVTLAATHGVFVYDDATSASPVDQGVCYNYFGGAQQVTTGTFTIVWHANGIMRLTN